jgi:hypothetical protein
MKLFSVILFSVLLTHLHAQSEEPSIEKNGVTNSNNLNTPIPVQPGVVEEERNESIEKTTILKEKEIKESRPISKASLKQKDANTQTIQVSSAKFSTQKKQAATQVTSRSPSLQQQEEMNSVVQNLEQYAPQSFEYNYFKYVSGNYNTALFPYLEKAAQLKPDNIDVHVQLVAYYTITKQKEKAKNFLAKLFAAGKIDDDILNYTSSLLASVPKDGVLVTHGFDDTYGALYQQIIYNKRSDISIISLDFVQSETYQSELIKAGYSLPNSDVIDNNYFQQFCKFNVSKKLYVSMTFPKPYLQNLQENMFVVGLTFAYRNDPVSTFEDNKILFETVVRKHVDESVVSDKAKRLSSNYLPMLFLLRKQYFIDNNQVKLKEVDEYIDKIAIFTNKRSKIDSLKK